GTPDVPWASRSAPSATRSPSGTCTRGTTTRESVVWNSTPRYFGIMIRTSCPRLASARGSAPATSASPPVLAKGATSDATRRMRRRFAILGVLLQDRVHQRGDVGGDPLQVGEHVQVDLGRLERLGEAPTQPGQVRIAQLALALPHHRPLVQHLLGEAAVVGREARDGALEVLGHHAVELDELGLPGLREAAALVELLPRQLHEVLVDDVADVLQVADERDQRDLLLGEVRAHGLVPEPRKEELDLALEIVELIVPPLHVLQQLLVVG